MEPPHRRLLPGHRAAGAAHGAARDRGRRRAPHVPARVPAGGAGGGGGGAPADPPQAALLELVDTRSGWPAVAAKGLLALAMRLAAAAPEARPVLPEALALLADLAAGGAGDPDSPSVRWPGKALPCQICLDAPRAAVFLPCRHAVACDACAAALTGQPRARCPICRTPVASVERAAGVVDRTWT